MGDEAVEGPRTQAADDKSLGAVTSYVEHQHATLPGEMARIGASATPCHLSSFSTMTTARGTPDHTSRTAIAAPAAALNPVNHSHVGSYGGSSMIVMSPRDSPQDSALALLPQSCDERLTTLVTQFDSSPQTYAAEDAGVQLHVRQGSLQCGQVAGPILIEKKKLLIECGGCSFLALAVVDCQPSGSTFDTPLDLDFRVEEDFGEEDSDGEDADLDEYLDGCKETIRDTYKILQREQHGHPWNILDDKETAIINKDGEFYLRAKFRHFSEGCLAKNILLDNAVHTEQTRMGRRPKKKELEFINATRKDLTFLVLPTTWSNNAIKSFAVHVGAEGVGGASASIDREMQKAILNEAMAPQVLQVPRRKSHEDPKGGERCTYDFCYLPKSGGGEARVVLVTVENEEVSVWFSRILREKTRLMIMPSQFSPGMNPHLGRHKLQHGSRCLVQSTFTATSGEPMSISNAPVSTVSSNRHDGVGDMDEGGG